MSDLLDLILDTSPANNDVGVPLRSTLSITLSGLNYDEDSLKEGFFVEGPDTDQFVGPGQIELVGNVSQGALDDFLQSPGYAGIVQGTVTVTGVMGNTVVSFTSTHPLAPLITYVVNLSDVLDSSLAPIDGFVSFSFDTGSGSIEAIPASVSTSVLAASIPESLASLSDEPLKIVSISPADRSIQNSTTLEEIVITFNKPIDPGSVDPALISVRTIPATDHPSAEIHSLGELAKVVEVVGDKLKLKI